MPTHLPYPINMRELGFDIDQASDWFRIHHEHPFLLIKVDEFHSINWPDLLATPFRRAYLTDDLARTRLLSTGLPIEDVIQAAIPEPGPVMSGDFGEILVYLYQASRIHPLEALGPKKWRLKQDRRSPAPFSDVVHFILPEWPNASDQDALLCSEVKAKSTGGASKPITDAIRDSHKDKTSRLGRTLVWLKERAILEDLGSVNIDMIDRFIKTDQFPPARKEFYAVAVICSTLLAHELLAAPETPHPDCTLVVIEVPNLRDTYAAVFDAIQASQISP